MKIHASGEDYLEALQKKMGMVRSIDLCLLYTSDAADEP